MKRSLNILMIITLILLSACTTINSSRQLVAAHAKWGIVPFTNHTEVPQAGLRAMSITKGLLEAKGITNIETFHTKSSCNQLLNCPNGEPSVKTAIKWAQSKHLQYVMVGAVNEWVYKVGLDGEPVVSVALQLYDVKNGRLIWSSVGSKFGTSRMGLSVTGQLLLREMLVTLKVF